MHFAPTLAHEHPGITIIDVVGAGPGAARNTGLKHVDADLYLLTDSDCVVAEDWCSRAIEWHANRSAPMGQGIPWLYQCKQNFELGKHEEMLYRHMFSSYLDSGRAAMIDPRCLMLSREYFDCFPRDLFAAWIPDASAEDRSVVRSLIQQGLRIDWCPDVRVFHEDPPTVEAVWRQKYRHGSGRLYVWPETPNSQFLLDRYFLSPIAAGIDPGYVVPAHLAFLIGYRDSCRHLAQAPRSEWWDQFIEQLSESVVSAKRWIVSVEAALSPVKLDGSCLPNAQQGFESSRPHG
jgi:cellulose synthase/poly-beta-1,6-N-acetylglucosamine synthase-like glycosyltransferase